MTGSAAGVLAALEGAGLPIGVAAAGRIAAFLDLLLRRNEVVNLVSRKEATVETLLARHVLDALEGLRLLPVPAGRPLRLLDVGSGGGFPAIPLLLARGDLEGVLVESTGKKARFLEEAIGALELTARVVNARFPDPAIDRMKNDPPCDLLTSRAVADAGGILRQARPVMRPGSVALFWTTEPLAGELLRGVPRAAVSFSRSPGAERRGIARVECFT
ncbi:MAG: 16S rRNA (guanine(527)-N(7))-methyltransferase RsmG [Thermoanaerobaculia bacterium]